LIIKLDALGDLFLFMSLLNSNKLLAKKYTLIISEGYSSVISDYFDFLEIHEVNKNLFYKNILYRIKLYQLLSSFKPHGVVNLRQSPIRHFDHFLTCIVNQRFTFNVNLNRENVFLFLQKTIYNEFSDFFPQPINFLTTNNVISSKYPTYSCLVIVPGASDSKRMYPSNKLVKLINDRFIKNFSEIIILDFDSYKFSQEIFNSINFRNKKLLGNLSLKSYIEVIKRSNFVIGNDSSAVHIASFFGIESLCFLGGGQPGQFLPYPRFKKSFISPKCVYFLMECYGCNWNCEVILPDEKTYPCINNIIPVI
jgi:ADP-heptose:LPS heptosyltransferase